MSDLDMLDIFAWIVLAVLVLSTVAVVVFLAALPGRIANRVKPAHIIRKVLLRQVAILNYVNPF